MQFRTIHANLNNNTQHAYNFERNTINTICSDLGLTNCGIFSNLVNLKEKSQIQIIMFKNNIIGIKLKMDDKYIKYTKIQEPIFGTSGNIHIYKNRFRGEIALKIFDNIEHYNKEKLVCEKLKNISTCAYPRSIPLFIKEIGKYCLLMDMMDGSLVKLIEPFNKISNDKKYISLVNYIIKQIATEMLCFYHKGLFYCDMKLDNVLFKCNGNRFHLLLGDLGSFVIEDTLTKHDMYFISTFYPIIFKKWKHSVIINITLDNYDMILSWNLGIIIFFYYCFMKMDYNDFIDAYCEYKSGSFSRLYSVFMNNQYIPRELDYTINGMTPKAMWRYCMNNHNNDSFMKIADNVINWCNM